MIPQDTAPVQSDMLSLLRSGELSDSDLMALSPIFWTQLAGLQILHPTRGFVPFELYPHQIKFLSDKAQRRLIVKARQIGMSQVCALEALHTALFRPGSTILFISRKEDLAANLLKYVRDILQSVPPEQVGGKLLTDNALEIVFPNGSRIKSDSAGEGTGRGFAGTALYMDEAAWMQFAQTMYQSALPMTSLGGRVTVLSSPNGRTGVGGFFYLLWSSKLGEGYSRHRIPWYRCPPYNPKGYTIPDPRRAKSVGMESEWYKSMRPAYTETQWATEYDCHRADTMALLADGTLKPVSQLDIGDRLLYNSVTSEIKSCQVVATKQTGIKPIMRVVTEIGTEFSASNRHKVVTQQGKIPLDEAVELAYVYRSQQYRAMTPEAALARLVAFSTGDGHIRKSKKRYVKQDGTVSEYGDIYIASFASKYVEDVEAIARDLVLAGLRNDKPSIYIKNAGELTEHHYISLSYAPSRKLAEYGAPVGSKIEQSFMVPDWIYNGSLEVQAEYLASLWGAEGSSPIQASGAAKACSMLQLHMAKMVGVDGHLFFNQLSTMLKNLGIESTVTTTSVPRNRIRYTLNIAVDKTNVLRFFDLVGYRYAARKERLAYQWAAYYRAYLYSAKRRGKSQPKRSFPTFAKWLSSRWVENTLFVAITERYDEDEEPTFNITVDSPDHSYLLEDGLNNQNCDFILSGQAYFRDQFIDLMASGWQGLRPPEPGRLYLKAWDIGRRGDPTVCFVADITDYLEGKGPVDIVWFERHFNLGYQDQVHLIHFIHDLYPGWTYVESNGPGDPLVEMLDRRDIEGYFMTAIKKRQALDAFKLLMERALIKCGVDDLLNECRIYEEDDKELVQDCVMAISILSRQNVTPGAKGGWMIGKQISSR